MSVVESFLEKGILVSPEILEDPSLVSKLSEIDDSVLDSLTFLDKDLLAKLLEKKDGFKVNVVFSYNKKPHKMGVNDFVAYFNKRFEGLSKYLRQRSEFQRILSISRLKAKKEKENVAVIGMVFDKSLTKKNSIILTIEDPTGMLNVIVKPDKKEVYEMAKELVLDDLVGIEGMMAGDAIFANQIILPEVPMVKELKKGPEEEYLAVIGDPQLGLKVFLESAFNDFFEWLNGNKGSAEQKEIASKVKYLFVVGDVVEGVGVYPGQEEDLSIKDVKEQYDKFAEYLKRVPSHIPIIICPGNHDVGRLSEPQPPMNSKYVASLKALPNVIMVSNPAIINVGATKGFPGFDVLLYHGYSFIYYANNVESIRSKGGQKRPDLIMKFLLQRRHLAPTHTSNLYIPDKEEDPMIISTIPDIFISGHIHRMSVGTYKNITLINASCWTGITEDQEKRGIIPQPAKVPLINLRTREVKVLNFLREESKDEVKEDDHGQHS